MAKRDAWRSKALTQDAQLIGRRLWGLSRDGERYRLANIAHNTMENWPRGVYEADCINWSRHKNRWDPSPVPECGCGLYAFWSLEDLTEQYMMHTGSITGIVMAWGRVLPGSNGFLAQYMMPVALDWPRCMSAKDGTDPASAPPWDQTAPYRPACGKPAVEMRVDDASFTDYPGIYDEDAETGYAWADMRCNRMLPLCEKHLLAPVFMRDATQGPSRFWIRCDEVMTDLERWYETEILPAGEVMLGVEARTELAQFLKEGKPKPKEA